MDAFERLDNKTKASLVGAKFIHCYHHDNRGNVVLVFAIADNSPAGIRYICIHDEQPNHHSL